jgi:hypothetical protein
VDLDANFTNQLKQDMYDRGAITIHGNMWRHYQTTFDATVTKPTLSIPSRMKSIKGIFSTFRDQAQGYAAIGTGDGNSIVNAMSSVNALVLDQSMTQCGISSYQYSIGSVNVPVMPVQCGSTGLAAWGNVENQNGEGCSEAFCELQKSWGKLHDISQNTSLCRTTFGQTGTASALPGSYRKSFVAAVDTQSFNSRALTENGIDTASRALPISLTLERNPSVVSANQPDVFGYDAGMCGFAQPKFVVCGPATTIQVDTFVMGDVFFYVDSTGLITPSF